MKTAVQRVVTVSDVKHIRKITLLVCILKKCENIWGVILYHINNEPYI